MILCRDLAWVAEFIGMHAVHVFGNVATSEICSKTNMIITLCTVEYLVA